MSKVVKDQIYSSKAAAMNIQAARSREIGKKWVQVGLFIVVFAIASQSLYAQTSPSSKTLDKVVLQLSWYHEFQFAGYYAAQLKGFYAEEGLDVEIKDRYTKQLPVDAVLSGQADFGNATSDIILLRMQGKPVVVLASIMQHSPWVILVRADSGITTLDDLIGKNVSMDMNYRDVEILALFLDERISTEKMTLVKKGSGVENLINGSVDARASYLSDQPFALKEKGFEPRVIRPINYGIDFYGDTLFTCEQQIRKYPKRVAAFRRASLRGWQYAMEHSEELIDHILATYYTDPAPGDVSYSREHLQYEAKVMAEDLMHPVLVEIGHMNPQRWRLIADIYADMGLAEPIGSLEEFIYDPDPVPDYRWFYTALGLLAGVMFVGMVARTWNKRLRHAVAARTRELQESNKKHKLLVDNLIETFLYRHDLEGVFNYVSSSVTQVLGYTAQEFETHFTEYLTDSPVNLETIKHTQQSINGIQQPPYEVEIYHKDRTVRWLEVSETPVLDEHGKVVAVEGVAHDITNRKQVEKTIQDKEAQLDNLLANVDAIILEGDPINIYYVGGQVERILGYPKEAWFDHPQGPVGFWSSLLHPDDRDKIDICTRAIEDGKDHSFEYRLRAADGKVMWFYDSVTVETENGKPVKTRSVMIDITERKHTEQALQETESRFRAVLENSRDLLYEFNLKTGTYDYMSPSLESLVGISVQDYIAGGFELAVSLLHPDDKERMQNHIAHLLDRKVEDEIAPTLEYRFKHPKLGYRWFSDNRAVIYDKNNVAISIVGNSRDITERKQADAERARLIDILETTSDFVSTATPDGKLTYLNQAGKRMLGWPEDEIIASTNISDTHPQRAFHVISDQGIPAAIELGIWEGETALLRQDGTEIPISQVIMAHKAPTGEVEYFSTIIRDITERKCAEEELQESESKLQAIFNQTFQLMGLLSLEGTMLKANRTALEFGEIEESTVIGKPFWETPWFNHSQQEQEKVQKAVERAASGEFVRYETNHPDNSGAIRTVDFSLKPILDADGQVIYLNPEGRDITERKQAESESERLIEELEAKNQEMERLVYTISHDMKTPLVTIGGYLGMLKKNTSSGDTVQSKQDIDRIENAASRMRELLDDLLQISRIGRLVHQPEDASLADLTKQAIELVAGHLPPENIQFDISSDLPAIHGDRSRMLELLQNLIENAIKYIGDQPQPRIEIGYRNNAEQPFCYVKDNGIGIDQKYHEKIFKLFEQLDPRKSDGTGAGLAIVKRIVESFDGKIWVESDGVGQGTTFCFTLPEIVQLIPSQ